MRCLTIPEIDAFLVMAGVRIYLGRPAGSFIRGEVIAIHAGAEPTSWAAARRRAEADPLFRLCLRRYGLFSRTAFKALTRGAIVGTVAVVDELDAAEHDAPWLMNERRKPRRLWEVAVARAFEPVPVPRARSNLWTLPGDLAHAIDSAATWKVDWKRVPAGITERVVAVADTQGRRLRGLARVVLERELKKEEDEDEARSRAQALEAAKKKERGDARAQASAWGIDIDRYVRAHQFRWVGEVREVKINKTIRLLAEFIDESWLPVEEFRRRMDEWMGHRYPRRRDEITREGRDAKASLVSAGRRLRRARTALRDLKEFERRFVRR
jgi:hypothetical protein